jgi:putative membrane-bound dehydrogenase-like protein
VSLGTVHAVENIKSASPDLKVPEGFSIELVAGPPLVERPIVAAFDDEGRLYVAESSGSNDKVEKQLEEKPHRVVRLEDADGDGKFDRRKVFADRLMLPEGAMFFDGSLYVAAPPSIWKLTDKDGDGVAEDRVEWYQGKTLTGCANDLHGPYAGPDGWIYWCKGAFAEQTHTVNGKEWKTKAAHIFRSQPDGSGFEPVMTGGMDNPVDVAFTADGERILSGTFFHVNPRQDGLIHAIYGGVYGKDHGVLEGHPRTGELMPILDPIPAAAGCGLERYDSNVFGDEYRDNLFLCQFNLRKVSRHILKPEGATYATTDSDFVWSDNVDFHPTDVLVDADGSLVVVDTGGWYKLCCPTSQLWKPDVVGGIYRVRRVGAKRVEDPRGRRIAWKEESCEQLWNLLADDRPAVRQRASRELVHRRDTPEIENLVSNINRPAPKSHRPVKPAEIAMDRNAKETTGAIARVWVLSQIESPESKRLVREYFGVQGSVAVRHAAMESIALHRDRDATALLSYVSNFDESSGNRRIAVEGLGRIGNRNGVVFVSRAADKANDRVLQHSVIYALIETNDRELVRGHDGLQSEQPNVIAAALIALDQMPSGDIKAADAIPHLGSSDETLRAAATWVVQQHPDWGGDLAEWLAGEMRSMSSGVLNESVVSNSGGESWKALENLLITCASNEAVQTLIADAVASEKTNNIIRPLGLRVMAASKMQKPPELWLRAIAVALTKTDEIDLSHAMAAAKRFPDASANDKALAPALDRIAGDENQAIELRVEALSILAGKRKDISDEQLGLLLRALSPEMPVKVRSAAADAVSTSHLSKVQLERLCGALETAGPLELSRLLKPFGESDDEAVGARAVASLKKSPSIASLRTDLLREAFAKYGTNVLTDVGEIESMVNVDAASQRKRIEELLPVVAKGDVRRGHAVFYSSKATCASCHRMGAAGGTTGPDLTHVGKTRTERDILESILFPSLSFVRSYEPMIVLTTDGKTLNGVIRDETSKEYTIATGPDQLVRVPRDEVDEIQPSRVSIMPAGLDKQLTTQEIADLVVFLKSVEGK